MRAYITIGLPGSGKSTWAKSIDADRINNDEIRAEIYEEIGNNTWSPKVEERVKFERGVHISTCAAFGLDIVVDNTHLNPKTLNQIVSFCESRGYEVEIVDFRHVPIETCIQRDLTRKGTSGYVGEKVIRDMFNKFMKEPIDRNLPSWVPNHLPDCIIVDIDGTLAQIKDRGPYDEHKVYNDDVRRHVLFTITSLMNANPELKVFIFSGRSDSCMAETVRWFNDKCNFYVDNVKECLNTTDYLFAEYFVDLYMRKTGDKRRDSLVKTDMYNQCVKDKYNVIAVFDDRPQVIRECWKVLNLPVFNCGLIDVEF
jgi:predicted kinase